VKNCTILRVRLKDRFDGIFSMVPGKQSNCEGNPQQWRLSEDFAVDVKMLCCEF
jgi:hypothetical protein